MLTEAEAVTLPLTASQHGLLVIDSSVSCRHLYNELVRFDLDPSVAPEALERALATTVALQPAMRQTFAALPEPHAILSAPVPPVVQHVTAPPGRYEQTIVDTAQQLCIPPFDLARGPLYRFAAVRADDGNALAVLLCDHHIILDGLSMGALADDLDAVLAHPPNDDDLGRWRASREAAFARELQAQQREVDEDLIAEWAAELRDVPPLVLAPLPGRPTRTAWSGARVSWRLDERDGLALEETCRRLDITPFVALTGLYGAVLARHGGVSRVLVGSPFLARRTVASFELGGFFVNTLPVTVDVDWSRCSDEHLGVVTRTAVDRCRTRVNVPFTRLVAAASLDRAGDRNPLFSALLAMQEATARDGAVQRITELPNGTAKFDLRLNATPTDGRWLLELEYDCELIAPAVADGLLTSLRGALRRACANGNRTVADLFADTLPATSLRSDGWAGSVPGPSPVEWVEAFARSTPDAVAIEAEAGALTYAGLSAAAGRVATGLKQRGVGRHDVVGIVAGDLRDTAIAVLAILRCGAAYLPLDPSLPAARLATMIDQAQCSLVIGSGPPAEIGVTALDTPGPPPTIETGSELPVYVMFTSGSTGRPKGVLMGRQPLANLAAWQVAALAMDDDTRFLQYAPLSFDVSFQELLAPLAAGATVVSREADRRDLPALLDRVVAARVTHLYLPVPVLSPLLELAMTQVRTVRDLRFVCVAGEQLLITDAVRAFFDAHPQCILVNLYGPTETHAVTVHAFSAHDRPWPAHAPIGRPIAGVAAYVVDSSGHLAPPGVPGELHLGGVCPADGYVEDPERTAERFLADRFAGTGRVYRTGDLALRDERGDLVFLGRADRQVKIRGHRIEPGELEVVAGTVDAVRQAAAVVRGEGTSRELVLFVEGSGIDLDRVSERLAAELPTYMQPAEVLELDRLPTTGSGKIDRDALADLAAERPDVRVPEASPGYVDDLECQLGAIWAVVLGVEGIPRDDTVLAHGAHSLNIFVALAEVQERFGVTVPMVEFFRSPTIATLAELVRAA